MNGWNPGIPLIHVKHQLATSAQVVTNPSRIGSQLDPNRVGSDPREVGSTPSGSLYYIYSRARVVAKWTNVQNIIYVFKE